MHSLMKCINRTARCGGMYRRTLLEEDGLNGFQHIYITSICDNPGISQEQLSKKIFINKSNITRQLCSLEQNGFITRVPKAEDKRVLQIFPTDKAKEIYPKVRKVMKDWNEYLLEEFTSEEQELLLEMLGKVMERSMEAVNLEGGDAS